MFRIQIHFYGATYKKVQIRTANKCIYSSVDHIIVSELKFIDHRSGLMYNKSNKWRHFLKIGHSNIPNTPVLDIMTLLLI